MLVFAGCLTGRRDWPTRPAVRVPGAVLDAALAHAELKVEHVQEDDLRPRFHCKIVYEASHAPFKGFNRAQAAVIEAAILASRLNMLPREKVERELGYLQSAVERPPARASTRLGACSSIRSRTTTSVVERTPGRESLQPHQPFGPR